jgi:Domain of unknown function (DUF5668)
MVHRQPLVVAAGVAAQPGFPASLRIRTKGTPLVNVQQRPPLFSAKLIFGLTIIAMGLILAMDNLHLYDGWHLLMWWPLVLAALGVAHLVRNGFLSLGGHVWLGLAVAGFIQQFGPWGLLDRWWPAFLIWGGLIVTLRALFPQPRHCRKARGVPPSPVPSESCDPGSNATQVKP